MKDTPLDGMHVAIIAMDGVEAIELSDPKEALERAGARVTLVAPKAGEIQGVTHGEKGERFAVGMTLDDAHPDEFDALLLPGGVRNADKLRMDPRARSFVQRFDQARKPIAAICHAPWLLVSAGLTKMRRLTSYYTLQDDIRNAGGMWEDREVITDGNWVTSREPKDLPAFDRAMITLFATQRAKTESAAKTMT